MVFLHLFTGTVWCPRVCPGTDSVVIVWDISSGASVVQLNGHTSIVYALCYSRDGTILASGRAVSVSAACPQFRILFSCLCWSSFIIYFLCCWWKFSHHSWSGSSEWIFRVWHSCFPEPVFRQTGTTVV